MAESVLKDHLLFSYGHSKLLVIRGRFKYSSPSLSGHSSEVTLSNMAMPLCHYYYQCIYFSLSPKAVSLMGKQFLGK